MGKFWTSGRRARRFLISRITHNLAVGVEGVGTILPFDALLRDVWTVFLTGFGERRGLELWHT